MVHRLLFAFSAINTGTPFTEQFCYNAAILCRGEMHRHRMARHLRCKCCAPVLAFFAFDHTSKAIANVEDMYTRRSTGSFFNRTIESL